MTSPARRLPPHRAMQTKPSTAVPVASVPIIKPEPPVSPVLTEHSAIASPVRRAGPHSKLGPHARKADAPTLPKAQDDHPMDIQNGSTETQQTKSDSWNDVKTDSWVDVHEPQVQFETEAAQDESSPVSQPMTTKGEFEAVPSIEHSYASNSAPSAAGVHTSVESNNITHRFGRNDWLSMLLDMDEPEKGRQLICAIADHLRASVDNREVAAAAPDTQNKEILVEFATGQCFPATIILETTIGEMIKECASLIGKNESDISIILKVGSKGHANKTQASEEL